MAWLRLDDRFCRHPKIAPLSDRHFRLWVGVLLWCAESRNEGRFTPEQATGAVVGVDNRFLEVCRANALLDLDDDGRLQVHDWGVYNGRPLTGTERQRAWRERRKRNEDVDERVDEDVDEDVDADVDALRARAGTRVRSPLSSRGSDRATSSTRKDERKVDEDGADAVAKGGSTTSSPSSPGASDGPSQPRVATNLDTGTIVAGTLDWCLGDCGKQYDLDELGAEGICASCRETSSVRPTNDGGPR